MMKYYLDFLLWNKFCFNNPQSGICIIKFHIIRYWVSIVLQSKSTCFSPLFLLLSFLMDISEGKLCWKELKHRLIYFTSSSIKLKWHFQAVVLMLFHSWLFSLFFFVKCTLLYTYKYSKTWYNRIQEIKKLIVKYVRTWYKLCQNLSIISMKCFLLFCFHSYFIPCFM